MAAFAQLAVVGRGNNTCVYVIAIFTMCESTEQRIYIKFCFKIGKTATETYRLLQQAYGEDAMGRTQVFDWFRPFNPLNAELNPICHLLALLGVHPILHVSRIRVKEGKTSVESDPRSGRPSTSRNEEMIAKVRTIFRNNRRLTVREIADDCGISVGSCNAILTDDLAHEMCMREVCAAFANR